MKIKTLKISTWVRTSRLLCIFFCVASFLPATVFADQEKLNRALHSLQRSLPKKPSGFTKQRTALIAKQSKQLEEIFSGMIPANRTIDQQTVLKNIKSILETQASVNAIFNQAFKLRSQYTQLPAGPSRRKAVRQYIQTMAQLRDLSGRVRFTSYDLIDTASVMLSDQPQQLASLVDLLTEYESSIGAAVMAEYLRDPEKNNTQGLQPIPQALKRKIINLISKTRQHELLELVVYALRSTHNSSELKLLAAETIRKIGLPQDPLVTDNKVLPQPEITAAALHQAVTKLNRRELSRTARKRKRELLTWLTRRKNRGITEPYYQLGRYQIRPGDWMLMRNPSPYNLFTDLSPGLFTHVGVVTETTDRQGKRHLVIIDMPERGTTIPAINVERYVKRTLDYMFLRHHDPAAAKGMATVAKNVIGNPALFDLNFKTSRVTALQGKDLRGKQITTYCAGLLLLCAQETKYKRQDYFPLKESMAGGNTATNLEKLGIKFGENFVSPTGPLFSPRLSIAAQREPMYSPGREIEQAIYHRFASRLVTDQLQPSVSAYHDLRLKLAEASKNNPLLKRALTQAVNISNKMDLVAAAKTAAVVETMDEVAYAQSDLYELAQEAFQLVDLTEKELAQIDQKRLKELQKMQQVHEAIFTQWNDQKISPRELRIKLVEYYIGRGQRIIDERFYQSKKQRSKKSP